MAVDNDTAAWVGLGLAGGVITIAMPAIPVTYLRQLHGAVEEALPA